MPLLLSRRRRFACLTAAFLLTAARSLAADSPDMVAATLAPLPLTSLPCVADCVSPSQRDRALGRTRPAALIPLYSIFGGLQVADAHSTFRALAHGSREVNPLLSGFAGSRGSIALAKAASFAGILYASERLWPGHPKLTVFTMVALDAALSAIVAHNYASIR